MGLVKNENNVILGLEGVIALILLGIFILSILAFINDYPGLGWFGLSVFGSVICIWFWFAGRGNAVVYALLAIFVLIGICAFATHVTPEWKRLTSPPKQAKEQQWGSSLVNSFRAKSSIMSDSVPMIVCSYVGRQCVRKFAKQQGGN